MILVVLFLLILLSLHIFQESVISNFFAESFIGFGIGFVGGLVGLLLGSIRLPAMISVLKMETKVAVGTNLAASSITGASSLVGHLVNGNVNFLIMITMGSCCNAWRIHGSEIYQ